MSSVVVAAVFHRNFQQVTTGITRITNDNLVAKINVENTKNFLQKGQNNQFYNQLHLSKITGIHDSRRPTSEISTDNVKG